MNISSDEVSDIEKYFIDKTIEMESRNIIALQDHLKTIMTISAWSIGFWIPYFTNESNFHLVNKGFLLAWMTSFFMVVFLYAIQAVCAIYIDHQGLLRLFNLTLATTPEFKKQCGDTETYDKRLTEIRALKSREIRWFQIGAWLRRGMFLFFVIGMLCLLLALFFGK